MASDLTHLSGEELLLLRIRQQTELIEQIEEELDRRAHLGNEQEETLETVTHAREHGGCKAGNAA